MHFLAAVAWQRCDTDFGGRAPFSPSRVATMDNWMDVVLGLEVQPPNCEPELKNCGSLVATPFFISFVFLVSIVMLNLFTAVIIENFEKLYDQEDWKLTAENLQDFVSLWSEYDDGTGECPDTMLPLVWFRHAKVACSIKPQLDALVLEANQTQLQLVDF